MERLYTLIFMKTSRHTYLITPFIKGISLFLILSGLLGIIGCSSNTQAITDWKSVFQVVPDDAAKEIINDFFKENVDATVYQQLEGVRLNKISFLFKINSPSYCGYLGCLHIAYKKDSGKYKPVFERYIYPYLPKNTNQIQLLKKPPNGIIAKSSLPCLRFFQVNPLNNKLEQITECFDGQVYQIVESKISPL